MASLNLDERRRRRFENRGRQRVRRRPPTPVVQYAEVEDLGVASGRDEDVRRLDVAMGDTLCVRHVEGIDDFDREMEQAFSIERLAKGVPDSLPFEQLH